MYFTVDTAKEKKIIQMGRKTTLPLWSVLFAKLGCVSALPGFTQNPARQKFIKQF